MLFQLNNTETIKSKITDLKAVLSEISVAAYQTAAAAAAPNSPSGSADPGSNAPPNERNSDQNFKKDSPQTGFDTPNSGT